MSGKLINSLIISLVLTVALETSFFLIIGKRNKKDLLLVVMVNIITNPVVVLLYWLAALYTDWNGAIIKVPLELFAVLAEGYYYKKNGNDFKRPYLFSTAANMFSYWTGVLIQLFI
jgi:hypothetical protein